MAHVSLGLLSHKAYNGLGFVVAVVSGLGFSILNSRF